MRTLGIDYGDSRVGIAITDALGITAQGLETIQTNNSDKVVLRRLDEIFKEYEENDEHYVDSVEFDDDFRNLKVYVDKDKYSSTATATSDIIVASAALSYQMFLEDGQKTVVEVVYSGTEEVVSTFSLPMNISIE